MRCVCRDARRLGILVESIELAPVLWRGLMLPLVRRAQEGPDPPLHRLQTCECSSGHARVEREVDGFGHFRVGADPWFSLVALFFDIMHTMDLEILLLIYQI